MVTKSLSSFLDLVKATPPEIAMWADNSADEETQKTLRLLLSNATAIEAAQLNDWQIYALNSRRAWFSKEGLSGLAGKTVNRMDASGSEVQWIGSPSSITPGQIRAMSAKEIREIDPETFKDSNVHGSSTDSVFTLNSVHQLVNAMANFAKEFGLSNDPLKITASKIENFIVRKILTSTGHRLNTLISSDNYLRQ